MRFSGQCTRLPPNAAILVQLLLREEEALSGFGSSHSSAGNLKLEILALTFQRQEDTAMRWLLRVPWAVDRIVELKAGSSSHEVALQHRNAGTSLQPTESTGCFWRACTILLQGYTTPLLL